MSYKYTIYVLMVLFAVSIATLLWGIPFVRGEQRPEIGPTPTLAPDVEYDVLGDDESACGSVEELLWLVEEKLPELFMVARADPGGFGMGPDAALEHSKLLTPYQVYWPISKDEALALDRRAVHSNLIPTGQWCIPVDWGDGSGALIRAHCSPEGWRVTGVGGRNELITVRNALRALGKDDALDSGSHASSAFYFVQGHPYSPDVLVAETSRGRMRAVSLDAEAITRSLESHDLATEPVAEALQKILERR